MKGNRGITLIELLIAMGVLGIVLSVAFAFFVSAQGTTSQQSLRSEASLATRLSFLRTGELVAQSAYIYPANQTLTLGGKSVATGPAALALLLPEGSTYCPGSGKTYCGIVYSIEPRTPYKAMLGERAGTTGMVLAEHRVNNLVWNVDTLPTKNWGAPSTGIVADSVDAAASSLSAGGQLGFGFGVGYDAKETFSKGDSTAANALIQSVAPRVAVRFTSSGGVSSEESGFFFSRAIPRGALPNP